MNWLFEVIFFRFEASRSPMTSVDWLMCWPAMPYIGISIGKTQPSYDIFLVLYISWGRFEHKEKIYVLLRQIAGIGADVASTWNYAAYLVHSANVNEFERMENIDTERLLFGIYILVCFNSMSLCHMYGRMRGPPFRNGYFPGTYPLRGITIDSILWEHSHRKMNVLDGWFLEHTHNEMAGSGHMYEFELGCVRSGKPSRAHTSWHRSASRCMYGMIRYDTSWPIS